MFFLCRQFLGHGNVAQICVHFFCNPSMEVKRRCPAPLAPDDGSLFSPLLLNLWTYFFCFLNR